MAIEKLYYPLCRQTDGGFSYTIRNSVSVNNLYTEPDYTERQASGLTSNYIFLQNSSSSFTWDSSAPLTISDGVCVVEDTPPPSDWPCPITFPRLLETDRINVVRTAGPMGDIINITLLSCSGGFSVEFSNLFPEPTPVEARWNIYTPPSVYKKGARYLPKAPSGASSASVPDAVYGVRGRFRDVPDGEHSLKELADAYGFSYLSGESGSASSSRALV